MNLRTLMCSNQSFATKSHGASGNSRQTSTSYRISDEIQMTRLWKSSLLADFASKNVHNFHSLKMATQGNGRCARRHRTHGVYRRLPICELLFSHRLVLANRRWILTRTK